MGKNMATEISNEELFQLLKEKLESMKFLKKFYIGKTNDIECRRKQHRDEGYSETIEIAHGDYESIKKAEEYLIKMFKDNCLCDNEQVGGGPKGNKLYISYTCDFAGAKSIDELDDDDLNWEDSFSI